jgi:hypothetical protein
MKREYFEERTFKTKELCETFVSVDLFTLQIERLKFYTYFSYNIEIEIKALNKITN